MNVLLSIGLLLIIGYLAGWLLNKLGLPRIIGFIGVGILFSPNTFQWIDESMLQTTKPLMNVCLAFITFEVGGSLRRSAIQKHQKEIINITWLASLIPYLLIGAAFYLCWVIFPDVLPFSLTEIIVFSLFLGALASPTDPSATLAVVHQYKAKGKVTDTIMGIAAFDDALGVLLFSLTLSVATLLVGLQNNLGQAVVETFMHIGIAFLVGALMAFLLMLTSRLLKVKKEGQWIVLLSGMIIFCYGITAYFKADELLACMVMGAVVVNQSEERTTIFGIIERYTEDLIFLFFFVLSGLQLNIVAVYQSFFLIVTYFIVRSIGKYFGAYTGAVISGNDKKIRRYTFGGLIPQGGIVIGLALMIYQNELFSNISEILLATVMGATVIHEIVGPIVARQSLKKAGEIASE